MAEGAFGLVVCCPYALHLPKLTPNHLREISSLSSIAQGGLYSAHSDVTEAEISISKVPLNEWSALWGLYSKCIRTKEIKDSDAGRRPVNVALR